MTDLARLDELLAEAGAIRDDWLEENRGRRVTTPSGQYKGRPGIVSGAILDTTRLSLGVLVMVERADGEGALNTNVDSRCYWPLSDWGEEGIQYVDE